VRGTVIEHPCMLHASQKRIKDTTHLSSTTTSVAAHRTRRTCIDRGMSETPQGGALGDTWCSYYQWGDQNHPPLAPCPGHRSPPSPRQRCPRRFDRRLTPLEGEGHGGKTATGGETDPPPPPPPPHPEINYDYFRPRPCSRPCSRPLTPPPRCVRPPPKVFAPSTHHSYGPRSLQWPPPLQDQTPAPPTGWPPGQWPYRTPLGARYVATERG
jgi:hypothetical protein